MLKKVHKFKVAKKVSRKRFLLISLVVLFIGFGAFVIIRSFASGRITVNSSAVAIVRANNNDNAYWIATSDGGVFSFGGAKFYGSMGGKQLDQPIVSMTARPQRDGYWLLGGDCGVFSFGSSKFYGRYEQKAQNFCKAIISTPSGNGYWLISRYGHIFKYGDASNYSGKIDESMNKINTGGYGTIPNLPEGGITSAARSGDGSGLILLDSNGKTYNYGDMPNNGSAKINSAAGRRATSIATTRSNGYIITSNDGSVYTFETLNRGGAVKQGQLNGPIVGIAFTDDYGGYWQLGKDGKVYPFGNAIYSGDLKAPSELGPAPIQTPITSPSPTPSRTKPNIILVLMDDLNANLYDNPDRFPVFANELVSKGTSFTNAFVVDSLCCPSRASLLRGQYPHNTGVISNTPPDGGLYKFNQQGLENSTVATWLQSGGYRTGFFGKYLNGYGDLREMPNLARTYIPPGWNEWVAPLGGPHTLVNGKSRDPYKLYNYDLNYNGKLLSYSNNNEDYLTDVLTRSAANFISTSNGDKPFFMFISPYVPHLPATTAVRYRDKFTNAVLPKSPSFNTAGTEEPNWMTGPWENAKSRYGVSNFTSQQVNMMQDIYRKQLRSMLPVEDMISDIISKLKETGELDNTYIIFTSDNGFHLGQHRLPPGKGTAYDTDTKVNLVVRGPGIAAAKKSSDFVSNIDIAPTIAKLANVSIPSFVDGNSFSNVLLNKPDSYDRKEVLIEHLGTIKKTAARSDELDPDDDTVIIQEENIFQRTASGLINRPPSDPNSMIRPNVSLYRALRTSNYLYVNYYVTGQRQLFDLRVDPYQNKNLYNEAMRNNPGLIKSLQERLEYLSNCRGAACKV
jgi:N-acetylglucosamine-6-sulfatase